MSNWMTASLVVGFILKAVLIIGGNSMTDTSRYYSASVKILHALIIVVPWGTGIIFYVIPFIISPWVSL